MGSLVKVLGKMEESRRGTPGDGNVSEAEGEELILVRGGQQFGECGRGQIGL